MTKNMLIVKQLFEENPYSLFNVEELLEIINKNEKKMSKRTIFRVVKALLDNGKIFCSDVRMGTRKFQLSKDNHCIIICQRCGEKRLEEIEGFNILEKLNKKNNNFAIKRIYIEINGICGKCR